MLKNSALVFLLIFCLQAEVTLALPAPMNRSCEASEILGGWEFSHYIYQGKKLPPRDPNMVMTFEFMQNGANYLHWFHQTEELSCARRGRFLYQQCQLMDEVVWTDPANSASCASDPDMRVGKQSLSRVEVYDSQMHLYARLGDDWLIYVWQRKSTNKAQ